jgi:hypothetical protein
MKNLTVIMICFTLLFFGCIQEGKEVSEVGEHLHQEDEIEDVQMNEKDEGDVESRELLLELLKKQKQNDWKINKKTSAFVGDIGVMHSVDNGLAVITDYEDDYTEMNIVIDNKMITCAYTDTIICDSVDIGAEPAILESIEYLYYYLNPDFVAKQNEIIRLDDERIAGLDAYCFDINAIAHTEGYEKIQEIMDKEYIMQLHKHCFSKEGVPLKREIILNENIVEYEEVVEYHTDVDERIFETDRYEEYMLSEEDVENMQINQSELYWVDVASPFKIVEHEQNKNELKIVVYNSNEERYLISNISVQGDMYGSEEFNLEKEQYLKLESEDMMPITLELDGQCEEGKLYRKMINIGYVKDSERGIHIGVIPLVGRCS